MTVFLYITQNISTTYLNVLVTI